MVRVREMHGMSETRVHSSWEAMRQRCDNPNTKFYEYYGGRGISYDPAWVYFSAFYTDMGDMPDDHVLDRIDSNANYCKENCRWVLRSESSFNTRKQHNNTSGKTGVCWSKKENRWIARIDFQGKSIRLGAFPDILLAIDARNRVEIEYFGYNKE